MNPDNLPPELRNDIEKLADSIKAKYGDNTRTAAHFAMIGERVCMLFGHDAHALLLIGLEKFCEDFNISAERVKACVDEVERAEKTVLELIVAHNVENVSTQGFGVGLDFFRKFQK